MFGLNYLLSPSTLEDFWEHHWGKTALFVPGSADKFPDLFGWEALTGLLNEGQPSPNAIRLVYDKQAVPAHEAVHVSKWLKKGATLIVNHLNLADPMVGRLSDSIARELNTTINTNCYSSWPVSQGFDLHYDGHDVYVINVEGRKAWKVFEPTFPYPLEQHARRREKPPTDIDPYLECVLDVGDVLYIPRGHWHYALAESPSMHLTVGVQSRNGAEFLQWLATQMANNDPSMRSDFSLARMAELGGGDPELLKREIEDFRERLIEVLEPAAIEESLLRYAMLNNPTRRHYQLPDLPTFGETVNEETWVEIAPDQKIILRPQDPQGDGLIMIARGREMMVRGMPTDSVLWLLEKHGAWQPCEALQAYPTLTWQNFRRLLEIWFDNGILRLVEA